MSKLLSFKLTHLAFMLVSGFVIMIAVIAISMFGIYSAAESARLVSSNAVEIITATGKVAEASDFLTNQARFYAVNGDISYYNAYWKEVNETKTREQVIEQLKLLGIPIDILSIVESAKQASDNLIKLEMEAFESVQKGDLKKATDLMFGSTYDSGKKIIVDNLNDFEMAVIKYTEQTLNKSSEKLHDILFVACVTTAVIAALFIVFLTVLMKGLTTSISKLSTLFVQIADGDMTVTAPIANGDSEIFEMYRAMNIFVKNIRNILTNAISASEEVASGSTQLAATMEELSSTFISQSQQVQNTASNMDTMNVTVKNSVMKLSDNENTIDQTAKKAHEGRAQLMNLKTSMENIHAQAESLSSTIEKLSISSAEIGSIINVINDIADQTNLLALNAAIEAARAGDTGRGFAVVADEVRKLAERSQKATSEVTSIINTLQQESEAASAEMNNASQKVTEGVTLIDTTGKVFDKIFNGIESIKNATAEVSTDITHEYESIQTINENTRSFATGIEQSSSAVSEVASTVSHLQERVNNLKNMITRFKVK